MEVEQIIKLMEAVSLHEISEISLEEEGTLLTIRKDGEGQAKQPAVIRQQPLPSEMEQVQMPVFVSKEETTAGNKVCSPLVGTFYAASAPGAEPYVKVGDAVKKGQVLGIVEAMKLMNEIESEFDGIVKSILVEDGNLIEYGQEMFIIG